MINFKDKKILILGLGILGGGVATVRWFYKKGAKLRITDLKRKKDLKNSLKKLENIKAKYILGKHRKEDFDWADIVVVNPGVSYKNQFVKYALEKGKIIENDCSLFFNYAQGEVIAITGTRGKTTTTIWIYEFLKDIEEFATNDLIKSKNLMTPIIVGGNQPEKSLLKIIDKTNDKSLSILELSSFQLEFYRKNLKAPKIAIITNLLNDHLNRYDNMQEYALAKAKIFQNQSKNDYLILNYDNKWTNFYLKLNPQGKIFFVSFKKLSKNFKGAFLFKNNFYIRDDKRYKIMNIKKFKEIYGEHNVYNLFFSFLASYIYLKDRFLHTKALKIISKLKNKIFKLKLPEFRQQIIYESNNLLIINDSAATSSDGVIAVIKRFEKFFNNLILIAGGTDKNLDFKNLAKEIKKKIKSENLILLNGSATKKLINELDKIKYKIDRENIFEELKDCVKKALLIFKDSKKSNKKFVIIFSPGSASFEKFKNEFDRGKKFNKIVKRLIKL